jgi:hypothetical protein
MHPRTHRVPDKRTKGLVKTACQDEIDVPVEQPLPDNPIIKNKISNYCLKGLPILSTK